jgi:hypothetical protein
MPLPAYVINLDSRPQSMRRLMQSFAETGLASVVQLERLPAVDMTGVSLKPGADAPEKLDILRRYVSPRTLMTMIRGERRYHHEFTSAGAVGCYLSHMAAWRKVAQQRGNRGALIIEDDAAVEDANSLRTVLRALLELEAAADAAPSGSALAASSQMDGKGSSNKSRTAPPKGSSTEGVRRGMPRDLDVLLIGWANLRSVDHDAALGAGMVFKAHEIGPGVMAHPLVREFGLAHMYYVSPAGARKLLQTALPIEKHVDFYIGQRLDPLLSRALGVEPLIVYGVSNTFNDSPLVGQYNPKGSSIGHNDCKSCGPFSNLRITTDSHGRSRSVSDSRISSRIHVVLIIVIVCVVAVFLMNRAFKRK